MGQFNKKSFINEDFFKEMTHELAWVLGLMAADGHISKDGRRVALSQSGLHGLEIINAVSSIIGWTGTPYVKKTIGQDAHVLRFTSKSCAKELARYGIDNLKTKNLSFPNIEEEFFSSFIRGYIDGDGSVGVYKIGGSKRFLIISVVGTEVLMRQFAEIVPASNCVITAKPSVTEARWNGQNGFLAGRWIYQNDELPNTKKSNIWRSYEKSLVDEPTKWYYKYI